MLTIDESFSAAIEHHQQGRLQVAERIYREILQAKTDHAGAWHFLGLIAYQVQNHSVAIEFISRSLQYDANQANAHNNLGIALRELGNAHEAILHYGRALELQPDCVETINNQGVALQDVGRRDEAIECFRRALQRRPDYAEAHNNLGIVFSDQGNLEKAVDCFRNSLAMNPRFAAALGNLGAALRRQGRLDGAMDCLRRALDLTPGDPGAYNNLSAVLRQQGKLDQAVDCCRKAIALKPEFADAWNHLGNALKDQGNLDEAIACYQRAVTLKPDDVNAHSNWIYTRIFDPGVDGRSLLDEHCDWNRIHAKPLSKQIQLHLNDWNANRKLRIGYVSPDFRNHVVGRNLIPLFREHDHQRFEISCYSDVAHADDLTAEFRLCSDHFVETTAHSDSQLAERIRGDQVDILVDLTLHMANNRLLVFARKPAPVQVTFAGYPGTTGLEVIDYRLTDRYLDPPGLNDGHYSEESIALADSFWCYDPLQGEIPINPPPAWSNGFVTFGCLNNFCKVNEVVLKLWARVLRGVDRSRIVIMAGEGEHRQRTLDLLRTEGIVHDRVTFVPVQPRRSYLKSFHDIDIGLDTIPYNGHATSLDSYWMGVPVVTLVGETVVGRAGYSQLMNLGLPELIATDEEQFVQIASQLALDSSALGSLRACLRDRMKTSPLMNASLFTRNIENAYLTMWRWECQSRQQDAASTKRHWHIVARHRFSGRPSSTSVIE